MPDRSITDEEFTTLIRLARRVLWADMETRRKIQAENVNIIPANFYSDIPLVEDLENSFEFRKSEMVEGSYNSPSIFNVEKVTEFVKAITEYAHEFDPPMEGNTDNPYGFFWKNTAFSNADAMSYYCIVRHLKPQKIVEIGSGFSTLVANMAMRENGFGTQILIEPFPKAFLHQIESVEQIIHSRIQDLDLNEVIALVESADIWFIDSTHTVKTGSDCLYIYLKVMPGIQKNMVVHTHDVALPFGWPVSKAQSHSYWTEQYLLYAYMLDNPKVSVLCGSNYILRILPVLSSKLMQGRFDEGGGSLWYELNSEPEPAETWLSGVWSAMVKNRGAS